MGFNISRYKVTSVLPIKTFMFGYYAFNFKRMLLPKSGNIEANPGPRRSSFIKLFQWIYMEFTLMIFSRCPWFHNFLGLTETFLHSSIVVGNIKLKINGYLVFTIQVTRHVVVFVCIIRTICQWLIELNYLIFRNV